MGLFDSVAGTFFNAATSAYQTVVKPVQTAVQTITRPIVQGSVSTGQTQQVAVQPRPPIVTSVAPSQQVATQYAAQTGSSVTPQQTPSGNTVYVTSRPSPIQPQPVIISRPVEVQAPSAVDVVGMLAPGAAIAGVATVLSGDRNVLQNAAMDIIGIRQQQIQSQASSLTSRNQALQAQATALQQKSIQQKAALEQQALGFQQRKTQLQQRVSAFESLGPATSVEEYNTRLNEYNVLNQDIAGLNAESQRINTEAVASNRNLIREQIGILNTRDQLRAEGVNLNVQAANIGTTGLAGLTTGFERRVDKPISDTLLTGVGSPFGMSRDDVALGLQLNRQVAEARFTFAPSVDSLSHAYGAGMLQDTLMKPGEAVFWTGVGIATGGVTRVLGPGIEGLSLAARAPGAGIATRVAGAGVRAAPYVMGGLFAGSVGLDVASQKTPGKMVSRFGGLSATEIFPMVGGGIVGYQAPEIISGAGKAMRGFRGGELGDIASELRGIPSGFRPTGELRTISQEIRSIPLREPTFKPTSAFERQIGGEQPSIERITDTSIQDDFLRLDYQPFEQAGKTIKPAVGLTREQLLPVPIEPQLSFVDFSKPVRGVPVSSQRLTPVYEVVSGKPGKYAYRGMQGKTNPLEGDPLGIVYEDIISEKILTYNSGRGAFEPTVTGRAWYKSITEYGLPKSDIFMQPAIEPLGTGKVFGPVKPGRTPLGKSLDTMVGRPSEQLAAYNDFAGWKGGMESALGGGGRMEFRGGGMVSVQEMGTSATSREIPQFVKPYTKFDTSGVVGIGASASSLAKASAVAMGVSGLSLYGLPTQEVGVRGIGADSYPLFMRQINYEKFYNVGAYPTTRGAFGAEADNRRYLGGLPTIGALRVAPQDYRDIADFTGINLDITSRRQGPIVAPTRMLSPVDIVGEVNIPETAFRVAPLLVAGPDLLQTPESRIIQIPKIDLTTQLITDQILINTPEIPPYQGYDFKFEIPPIPPIIIPGFPMAPGGGGGGGGGAGGLGGYTFEETLQGGGDSDPFGIGGMNFDAGAIAGIPSGSRTKRRRRKK